MLVSEMVESIVGIVQDGAYQEDEVSAALDNIALAIGSLVRIPSSKRVGDVVINATDTSTNLQDTLTRFSPMYCSRVWNATTEKFIKIYDSLELLFTDYPSFAEEGDIEAAAFEDYMLWTQKVAQAEQHLTLVYYMTPDVPSIAGTVKWIPEGLHYNLLVCGTVGLLYGELEDGLEHATGEGKPNTGFFASRYYKGIKEYRDYMAKHTVHRLSGFWSE